MRNTISFVAMVVMSGPMVFAQAGPSTAPADVPTAKLDSPFSLVDRVNSIVAEREGDPIKTIAADMGVATNFLTRFNTSEPVQPQQKAIIGQLDTLIAMLEEQKKNSKAGAGSNPNNPLPDSAVIGGKLTYGQMRDPGASSRMWGQLPPKERERILQSQNEGFPAGYESILSSYYRRLAQESVTGPAAPEPSPAPPAATP